MAAICSCITPRSRSPRIPPSQRKKRLCGGKLQPFAKVLLALVARREDEPELARQLLEELNGEFPGNPLFRRELALLKEK